MEIKIILLFAILYPTKADDIDLRMRRNGMRKILREMVNQTNADTLNLPANSTSIRENIVDTFSCENRTYGYYADVDNACQVFHVCLPTQTPSGRNITYRWSFICPKETVFNQEVLVCTRERESIPCEESPAYYDKNLEFGKVENDTIKGNNRNEVRRKPPKRKENLIVQTLLNDALNRIVPIKTDFDKKVVIGDKNIDFDEIVDIKDDINVNFDKKVDETDTGEVIVDGMAIDDDDERLFTERSFNQKKRFGFRFKADVV